MAKNRETVDVGGVKKEIIRVKTVGADFDADHYAMFELVCETMGIDRASLIRKVMYEYLDNLKGELKKHWGYIKVEE